jgi:glycosyltransferase involved in cell wall biosynthesis
MDSKPLVSIIIPNYNHSMYLDQSIQSALNQTYSNIEVILNDNCSTDNSIEVAAKYIDQGVIINKNPQNINNLNYDVLDDYVSGKYFILLCADDVLKENFVEKAVAIMEKYSEIGFVHGERDYIDEHGHITVLDPFFNCSFRVDGSSMLPIFVITEIGQSAQALIRKSTFEEIGMHDTESDHLNIDREQWFRLAMVSEYAYIREKVALIRIPETTSETSRGVESFHHPILLYHAIKSFEKWGHLKKDKKVLDRMSVALERISKDCIGFAKVFLKKEMYPLAKKYLLFIKFTNPKVVTDDEYQMCLKCLQKREGYKIEVEEFKKTSNYAFRVRNYNPPENFVLLKEKEGDIF